MQLGMIGLGRMGANMTRRLMRAGHEVVVYASTAKSRDTIIDGGNSSYVDDIRRAKELAPRGIHYVDCGTSGGVWGLERGYCLMIGGETPVVQRLDPIFATLAPGTGQIAPTAGRK